MMTFCGIWFYMDLFQMVGTKKTFLENAKIGNDNATLWNAADRKDRRQVVKKC